MNLKKHYALSRCKKNLIRGWYWLMKPIAYFFTTEKLNKRYKKQQAKITEDQAIRYIAEDIGKYLATRKDGYVLSFIVADYINRDDFSGFESLAFLNSRLLKRNKTRMGYYKLKRDIRMQEAVIDKLKSFKGIQIAEEVESFTWQSAKNYQKTYHVRYVR